MKIVIATAVYYPMINGVAVFAHNLALGLARRGHEVLVLCPSQTGKNYVDEDSGVKVVHLKSVQVKMYPDQIHDAGPAKEVLGAKMPKIWYRHGFRVSVFPEAEVREVLDKFRPDVVHVQVSDPIGLSVVSYAKKRGIPVVTTEHNEPEVLTESLKMPRVMKKGANAVLKAYFRNRQSKSDFVTMPTEEAILNLLNRRDAKEFGVPVAAVSNGVDLRFFQPGKAPKEIYEKYGISEDALIVLYVGRVDPEKQVGRVIEAFARMMVMVPEETKVEMVIVGDGVDKARLMEKVKKMGLSGNVRFLGRVLAPDLYELYKVGDVFVTASEIETQGIVLIEAAATGLPLIAVNKGAVKEVCRGGENGFLVAAGDEEGMAEAMREILTDEEMRQRFGAKSLEIASGHDLEKTIDKFINIYTTCISSRDVL